MSLKTIRPNKFGWFTVTLAVLPLCSALFGGDVLGVSLGLSLLAFLFADRMIGKVGEMLIKAGRSGRDLNKPDKPELPESLGVVVGAVYLMILFLFLPFPFIRWFGHGSLESVEFPFRLLGEYTAALLSICSMLFLGFADDVLNLKWRHKIALPAMATLPLLIIYRVTYGVTSVVVPVQLRPLFNDRGIIDLGPLYYAYMAMMAVFCTHSINILAGVNGVEVGQSLVLAAAIVINSLISIIYEPASGTDHAQFALYLMLPFLGVSGALLKQNWWPARVFVGDTYCYFAGMTLAVVGILGHYSKTMLLFFGPQLVNFAMSVPQLIGMVPCPRHRLPRLNVKTGKLEPSTVTFSRHSSRGLFLVKPLLWIGLVKQVELGESKQDGSDMTLTNFTLLNALLNWAGPMREDKLTILLMLVQASSCAFGLLVRYYLSRYFFPA